MMRPAIAAARTLLKAAGVAISTGEAKSRESGGDKYSVRVLTMVDRDALPHQFPKPGRSCDV
jgi:hypothetical protein